MDGVGLPASLAEWCEGGLPASLAEWCGGGIVLDLGFFRVAHGGESAETFIDVVLKVFQIEWLLFQLEEVRRFLGRAALQQQWLREPRTARGTGADARSPLTGFPSEARVPTRSRNHKTLQGRPRPKESSARGSQAKLSFPSSDKGAELP
ncbi:hypothetical protein SKAU_G00095410 [Synaphobranchus kaupii]|uniref:Uncharacterized protein n=1 Tax=Synaphobranchus kaupii TaxID=118154 RepID=A0A9Q1J6X7_SYNKA|nr:hypothetical protein SKAU_G00095410 [Synaphobranchus kaupii]